MPDWGLCFSEVISSIDKERALSFAYFSKDLTVFYSLLITRFMIYMGGINSQLMLQSAPDDHWPEDSSEISSYIYNILNNDLDNETACTFSKPATDTKQGAGTKCWRAGLQHKGIRRRMPWNSFRTSSGFLIWDETYPCNNPNWRITVQRQAWDPSDHQVEYELGECSCSTEGYERAYILWCVIDHNQQVFRSGSSCYMAGQIWSAIVLGSPGQEGHDCPRERPPRWLEAECSYEVRLRDLGLLSLKKRR